MLLDMVDAGVDSELIHNGEEFESDDVILHKEDGAYYGHHVDNVWQICKIPDNADCTTENEPFAEENIDTEKEIYYRVVAKNFGAGCMDLHSATEISLASTWGMAKNIFKETVEQAQKDRKKFFENQYPEVEKVFIAIEEYYGFTCLETLQGCWVVRPEGGK